MLVAWTVNARSDTATIQSLWKQCTRCPVRRRGSLLARCELACADTAAGATLSETAKVTACGQSSTHHHHLSLFAWSFVACLQNQSWGLSRNGEIEMTHRRERGLTLLFTNSHWPGSDMDDWDKSSVDAGRPEAGRWCVRLSARKISQQLTLPCWLAVFAPANG
jgi:hypothetical protein